MIRIWLPTAPLAFRLVGAGGGTVDNRNPQGLHLRNPKSCPNKPSHLSNRVQSIDANNLVMAMPYAIGGTTGTKFGFVPKTWRQNIDFDSGMPPTLPVAILIRYLTTEPPDTEIDSERLPESREISVREWASRQGVLPFMNEPT